MNDIFTQNVNSRYSVRQVFKYLRPLVNSVYHGSESVSYLGSRVWDMQLDDCKDINNLNNCKNKVQKWQI